MADFPASEWAGWSLTDLVDFWTAARANAIADEVVAIEQNSRKQNFVATTAPTVNEDSGDGYKVGSLWYDVTNDKTYMCLNNSVGAAIWKRVSFLNDSGTTATRVLFVDSDGMPTGDADFTWDGSVLAVGGSSPVSGATLDVAGDIVVSDGAGAIKSALSDDGLQSLTQRTIGAGGSVAHTGTIVVDVKIASGSPTSYRKFILEIDIVCVRSISTGGGAISEKLLVYVSSSITPTVDATIYTGNSVTNVTITRSSITGGFRYTIVNSTGGDISVIAHANVIAAKASYRDYWELTVT